MEHSLIKNDFFNEKVKGPTAAMSLQEAIYMALGGGGLMPKRLSPAGTICNGRIYYVKESTPANIDGVPNELSATETGFVFSSDINILAHARALAAIAYIFGVELFLFHETGSDYYWRSSEPDTWYGGYVDKNGSYHRDGIPFYEVRQQLEEGAAKQQRQWQLDHGFINRNFKEYMSDLKHRWNRWGRISLKDCYQWHRSMRDKYYDHTSYDMETLSEVIAHKYYIVVDASRAMLTFVKHYLGLKG